MVGIMPKRIFGYYFRVVVEEGEDGHIAYATLVW